MIDDFTKVEIIESNDGNHSNNSAQDISEIDFSFKIPISQKENAQKDDGVNSRPKQ